MIFFLNTLAPLKWSVEEIYLKFTLIIVKFSKSMKFIFMPNTVAFSRIPKKTEYRDFKRFC